ncbi:MAG: rod shape-determining protein MreC, partial [Gammaproteobacteria bacterium]|nr:rod shape-determining protein MreC [Gammaproteobacteria bacterium]
QIIHTSPVTATALLISDPNHALPVQLNRNGLRTIASGTGEPDRLELLYIPNSADVRVGDLVVTSGLGGRFPPNYPVATVVLVERRPGEPFARVVAEPRAQLDRSREVLLVWPDEGELPPATAADEEKRSEPTDQP